MQYRITFTQFSLDNISCTNTRYIATDVIEMTNRVTRLVTAHDCDDQKVRNQYKITIEAYTPDETPAAHQ